MAVKTGDPMLDELYRSMDQAERRYGDFTSTHEAYGVLVEEVAELFDAIRANSLQAAHREAVQVAAVALRLAAICASGYETPFGRRSTK